MKLELSKEEVEKIIGTMDSEAIEEKLGAKYSYYCNTYWSEGTLVLEKEEY